MKVSLRWVVTIVAVLFFSFSMLAQDTGQITGTVHDSSGAAVPNAKVTVSNRAQGIDRPTVSNSTGDWLVGGLPGGTYTITVEAPGFKKFQAKDLTLRVGQKLRQDANLQIGATATEITVQGSAVAPETQTSDLAGTVTGKEITQLQLNGRNFTQLVTLTPGVTNQTGQQEGTVGVYGNVSFSMNGGRVEYNNWELDGGDNMDNGSNSTLNVYPSIDAIAETRVLTSNYGAQYGRNGSGTVETEIKSGTSAFHGDVYEFVRNDAFNARNYFQQTVPPYKKNDYGYTIGGPVYIPGVYNTSKQKTFFFWSQEWRKDRVPGTNFNTPVPSLAERAGNFSDVCPAAGSLVNKANTTNFPNCPIVPGQGIYFPNNQVPVDPNGAALVSALVPAPNSGGNFVLSPVQPTNWREELLRIDENLTSKNRLSFHYIHDSWDTQTATPLWTNAGDFPTIGTNFKGPGVSLVARLNTTASPSLLNEFVVSYTTDHIILFNTGFPNPNAWQRPSTMNMGALFGVSPIIPGISLVNSASQFTFGEDPGYIPNGTYNSNPSYTIRDNVTKIVGRHNLQFGVFSAFRQKNELGGELGPGGTPGFLTFNGSNNQVSSGNPFADMLMGNIDSFGQQRNIVKYYNREKSFEPYFQDDWRVTDRLTLNLGLRMSMFGLYSEKNHQAYNFDPRFYDPATAPGVNPKTGELIYGPNTNPFDGIVQCGVTKGVPAGCMQNHLLNPAPRIGFAFDPFGNGQWAIRGGYGIFWEETNGNEGNTESLENSPPGVLAATQSNIASTFGPGGVLLGSGYNGIRTAGPTATNPLFPISVVSIPYTQVQWPYVQQWHLDVQHEIAKNTVATLSYVGSKGTHLTRQVDFNQLHPVPASANPFKPGEVITKGVCTSLTTESGVPVTGQALLNLNVACGNVATDAVRSYLGYGNITGLQDAASSIYHAMQFSLRHSMGGLQLNVAYTYAHSIDDSSDRYSGEFVNTYDPAANRASSNFDQRHVLNVGYVYDLPFFRGSGLTHALLGGWQWSGIISASTGTPFSVTNGGSYGDNAGVGNGVGTGSYVDLIGNPNTNPGVPVGSVGPYAYNPAAFALPTALTFGNVGRNFLRNGSFTNFDMALFKHFVIHEQIALEFRAEAFNIFNHTAFAPIGGGSGGIGGNFSSSTNTYDCSGPLGSSCIGNADFLNYGAAFNPRILQLGLKFLF